MTKYSPIYNTEKKLFENCINSVVTQDYKNLEIIIVNDGSNPETSDLCRNIAKKDERITLLEQPNSGVSTARNNGIERASGDYIAFLDSDDTFSPGFFSAIEKYKTEEDILIYGMCLVYPNKRVSKLPKERTLTTENKEEICCGILMHNNEIEHIAGLDSTACKVYRTAFLKDNHIQFNTKLRRHEDSLFCLNAFINMKKGKIVPFIGYNYIFNPKSICQRFDPKVFDDTDLAINEYSSYINSFFKDNQIMQNALNFKIADIIMSDCTTRYFTNKDNPDPLSTRRNEFKKYLNEKKQYKNAFINLKAGFPFSFYSRCIKNNKIGFMFNIFAFTNNMIRFLTIR